jgi:putative transposase
MRANQACFPISLMARVLGVSKAGYYAWRHRPLSARARADDALLAPIKTVHISSRQTYGAPRVHAKLQAAAERHGRKRIARLMRQAGLVGASRRRGGPITTSSDKQARPAPDLVDRDFQTAGPNQLWVAAITYVPTAAGSLYLAVVLDVWSRRVVGWAMANHLRTELVLDALNMALGQCRPRQVIHHSDQGSQYTSLVFGKPCKKPACGPRWVRSAMPTTMPCARASLPPSNANCWSGAASPHRSRRGWPALASSNFYNPTRQHSALGYRSPIRCEEKMKTDR